MEIIRLEPVSSNIFYYPAGIELWYLSRHFLILKWAEKVGIWDIKYLFIHVKHYQGILKIRTHTELIRVSYSSSRSFIEVIYKQMP